MKKTKLLLLTLLISYLGYGQAPKDTSIYLPDSVNVIAVNDLVSHLKYLEDKVTKKDYDKAVELYTMLLQLVEPKRRKKLK